MVTGPAQESQLSPEASSTSGSDPVLASPALASPTFTRRQRRAIFWISLTLLSLPIIVAAVQNLGPLDRSIGDSAVIELYAQDIPGRLPLVGVFSRYGFHHPGPMLYYVVALPVHVFGAFGLALTGALVAIASLGGILFVLHRRGGPGLFALGVLLDVVLLRSMALDVLTAWNPYILVLPFGLAITLTWSVWCRDWRALPWLALVSSFIVQAHVGTTPSVGFMLGTAMLWAIVEWRRHRCPTRPLVTSSAVLVLAWLPPLIEQFTHDPGNISQMISVGGGGSGETPLGPANAFGLLGHLLGRVNPLTVADTGALEFIGAAIPSTAMWLVLPAALLVISAVLARRERLIDELRLTGLLAGVTLSSVVFLSTITGFPFLYLVRWIIVINCFIWMNLIWILIRVGRSRFLRRDPSLGRHTPALAIAGLTCALIALLAVAVSPLARTSVHVENLVGAAAIRSFEGRIDDSTRECGLIEVRSRSESALIGPFIASGVVADLRQRGVDAVIQDAYEFAHGPEHSLRGRVPDCVLTITATVTAEIPALPTADGDKLASFDTLNRRERTEYRALSQKKASGPLSSPERHRLHELSAKAISVRVSMQHLTASS